MDAFDYWKGKFKARPQLEVYISDYLQKNATAEDLENHIDIVDWLIRTRNVTPGPDLVSHCAVFLLAAKYLDPEMAPEVEAMIYELGLEKIETND